MTLLDILNSIAFDFIGSKASIKKKIKDRKASIVAAVSSQSSETDRHRYHYSGGPSNDILKLFNLFA